MSNVGQSRFDAIAGPLFVAAGMGDPATFRRGAGDPIALSFVYLDQSTQSVGIDLQTAQNIRTVRLFKQFGLPRPRSGDLITLNPDTVPEPFKIDGAMLDEDASSYVCVLIPVQP